MAIARIVALPLLLVVMVGSALNSWTLFTGWGLLASYVGSHEGGLASRSELDAARARALLFFWSMIALQLLLFITSGFFARILARGTRSVFWPSLKNWAVGLLLSAGIDGVVVFTMLYRQTRG